jgi:hypothetical protein
MAMGERERLREDIPSYGRIDQRADFLVSREAPWHTLACRTATGFAEKQADLTGTQLALR